MATKTKDPKPMTTDAKRVFGATDDPEITARANRAVKSFRDMQFQLTGFARIMTKREDCTVEMYGGVPCTDGKMIYLRPPIELGDRLTHGPRAACDRRDDKDRPVCPACCAREDVLITLYHEIAHIAFDSFEKVTDADKQKLIERAVKEAGGSGTCSAERATKIAERIQRLPIKGYMEAAGAVSPFLPPLLNALEDVRVNHAMYSANPGTFRMFRGQAIRIFEEGIQKPDGTYTSWREAGRNAQMIVGCLAKAAGYPITNEWVVDEVLEALKDKDLDAMLDSVATLRSARGVYELAFRVLENLRGQGFCKLDADPEEEPPPPPPPPPTEEDEDEDEDEDEKPEGEGETDESDEDADGDPTEGGDPCEDGEPSDIPQEGDPTNPDGSSDDGEDTGGDSDSEGAEDDPQEGEQEGDGGDPAPEGEGEDSTPQEGDPTPQEGEGDPAPEGEDDAEGEGEGEGGSAGPDDDESSDENEGGSEGDDSSDTEGDGEEAGQSGEGEGEAEEDAETGDDSGDGDDEGDGESDQDGEGEGHGGLTWDGDEPSTPSIPEDDDEDSEKDGEGEPANDPLVDDSDEVDLLIRIFGGHGPLDGPAPEDDENVLAIDRAIVQEEFFDAPSTNIYGVRIHKWGQPVIDANGRDMSRLMGWATTWTHDEYYSERFGMKAEYIETPESVLGPSLLKMRAVFQENKRAATQRNLDNGERLDVPVLGRRLATGDYRVFKKVKHPGKKDYFVVIGMDLSGSTTSGAIRLIKQAAMAQAEMCQRTGVRFAVYGHTGYYHNDKDAGDYYRSRPAMDVDIFVVKEENEPWDTAAKERLIALSPSQANIDGHTLEFYRKRCDESQATDKIILYYTDGAMPAENYDEEIVVLKREIQNCQRRGYTLLGVGIETDSPKRWGLDTVQIDGIEDLPAAVKHLEKRMAVRR